MMTLTDLSVNSRKFAPFAVFVFIILTLFFYLVKLLFSLTSTTAPTSTGIVINPKFQKILPLSFKNATTSADLNFTLDNIEGQAVTATEAAHIYYLPESKFRLDYIQKIYTLAKAFGFDTEVVKHQLLSNNQALFQDNMQKLTVDITNYNFRYDYNFKKDYSLLESFGEPDKDQAQQRAIDFLKTFDRYPVELSKGSAKAIFLHYDTVSSSTAVLKDNIGANMVEIDFFRPEVDTFPVVSSTFFNSPHYVTMIVGSNGYRVVSAQIKFYEKSDSEVGVYPLISGQEAYKRLLSGKGFVVSKPENIPTIVINKMFLAYYDPDSYIPFLQPVYVFLDEKHEFVGYVPAVVDEWIAVK